MLTPDHDERIKADPNYLTTLEQKFLFWNNTPSEILNYNTFWVTTGFPDIDAQYWSVSGGVTIKNYYISANGLDPEEDVVFFKDPWLISYNHPPYGIRNDGMLAPFESYESPLQPTLDSDLNGDFLNQIPDPLNPDVPYYTVKAQQNPTVYFHGEPITWYFQGWAGDPDSVAFEYAGRESTAVVFKESNAVVKAKYKGHLASSVNGTTADNNQRKIVRATPSSPNVYMVYEDNGEIYFTSSSNNGTDSEPRNSVKRG